MSKSRASPQQQSPAPPQVQSGMISTQSAIYILNEKIQKVEGVMKLHMDDIERKFGEHETYVTDNIPDLDLINKALSDINTRLIDLESLEGRIAALESAASKNAPSSPVPTLSPTPAAAPAAPAPAKKRGGTVKLADISPAAPVEPGISFS